MEEQAWPKGLHGNDRSQRTQKPRLNLRLSAGGSYTVTVTVPAAGYEIQDILAEKERSCVL